MAQIPTEQQIEEAQLQARLAEEAKRIEQEAQGKSFNNNGQGVMSEAEWAKHKQQGGQQ